VAERNGGGSLGRRRWTQGAARREKRNKGLRKTARASAGTQPSQQYGNLIGSSAGFLSMASIHYRWLLHYQLATRTGGTRPSGPGSAAVGRAALASDGRTSLQVVADSDPPNCVGADVRLAIGPPARNCVVCRNRSPAWGIGHFRTTRLRRSGTQDRYLCHSSGWGLRACDRRGSLAHRPSRPTGSHLSYDGMMQRFRAPHKLQPPAPGKAAQPPHMPRPHESVRYSPSRGTDPGKLWWWRNVKPANRQSARQP